MLTTGLVEQDSGRYATNNHFCRMFGLVVMEGMTLSGHLSNINEIYIFLKIQL